MVKYIQRCVPAAFTIHFEYLWACFHLLLSEVKNTTAPFFASSIKQDHYLSYFHPFQNNPITLFI